MTLESAVAVARNAMAARFEIILPGANSHALRAAGEEALDEVERLEAQLSIYRSSSEIARVNALASRRPVKVSPPVFQLLKRIARLYGDSAGMFDITIAPLVRCWGFMGGTGQLPDEEKLASARALIGFHHLILDTSECSVRFDAEGVMIDLGAVGKGHAIDCAARLLREAGVTSALIHGGTSTTYALGHPPGADSWKVAIANSPSAEPISTQSALTVSLRDESLSVSAGWGKSFKAEGKTYGHILDPRTGRPVSETLLAAVSLPSATDTDALSTALLVAGERGAASIAHSHPGIKTILITGTRAILKSPPSFGIENG